MILKPCPFCGGRVFIDKRYPYDGYQGESPEYMVGCSQCSATMQSHDRDEVIADWNKRTTIVSKQTLAVDIDTEEIIKYINEQIEKAVKKAMGVQNESK